MTRNPNALPSLPPPAVSAALWGPAGPDLALLPLALRSWAAHRHILEGVDLFAFERAVAGLAAAAITAGRLDLALMQAWALAGATLEERHDRRAVATAVRLVVDHPHQQRRKEPAVPPLVTLPALTGGRRRPLRPFEVAAYRAAVEIPPAPVNPHRWGAVVALLEAGAGAMELPAVGFGDIDLSAGTVRLPGTPGRTEPRTGRLSRWGLGHLRAWAASLSATAADVSVVYRGDQDPLSHKAASAIGMVMSHVLTRAGIRADDVAPESLRNTTAARAYNGANAQHVQALLGCRSLDQALREIGAEPHKPLRQRPERRVLRPAGR